MAAARLATSLVDTTRVAATNRPPPLRPLAPAVLTLDDVEGRGSSPSTPTNAAVRPPTTPSLTSVRPVSSKQLLERSEAAKGSFAALSGAQKVAEISGYFRDGQDLVAVGREYVMDGVLTKICRKAPKQRRFFLFNDILVYGSILTKKSLSNQCVLPLVQISLVSMPDEPGFVNAFEILSTQKSFIVMASTPEEKTLWMDKIKYYATLANKDMDARGAKTGKNIEWVPIWTPDQRADYCSLCQVTKFTTFNRRHHCRNCRRVVCGGCSSQTEVLPGLSANKKVRVCDECALKVRRTNFRKMIQPAADSSASRLEWLCDSDSDSESEDLESLQTDHKFTRHHRTQRVHGV